MKTIRADHLREGMILVNGRWNDRIDAIRYASSHDGILVDTHDGTSTHIFDPDEKVLII